MDFHPTCERFSRSILQERREEEIIDDMDISTNLLLISEGKVGNEHL
jgi:hypothetical protein